VLNTSSLPREFSVLCPNCRGRKFYQAAQVHDQKQDAEAAQIARRGQFGMKHAIDRDRTAEVPIQAKSLLNEFASWLLQ